MNKWQLNFPQGSEAARLGAELNLSPIVAGVLLKRGLKDKDEALNFLKPRLNTLRDPFEIPNIQKAAERVLLAKSRGEKIAVYGDYDVDGVTGTAILVSTLKFLGLAKAIYYIPDRYGEGYSLSLDSVQSLAEAGVKLIITVDCGIASAIEIEAANALGLEVIVTDHHNLPKSLPKALAIVNPKQLGKGHPSRDLSGAGVAFKFAWALLRTAGEKDNVFLTSLLDLASLGTIADVVPLNGENRVLAVNGLNVINERTRLGLKHLAESASLHGKISVGNINFGLAPRINAAGRLEHASKAVDLLLADDPIRAKELAKELSSINSRRQEIGSKIKAEVFSRLSDEFMAEERLIILAGENWHPGVIGIVASQVAETYYRPTILVGINGGVGRGSARSVDGLNIFNILDKCHDLFLDFGGHEGAAGFEINCDDIDLLKRRLLAVAAEMIRPEELVPEIEIDAVITPPDITLGLIKEIEKLEPFGEGNRAPAFMMKDLTLDDFKLVGKEGKHLKGWFTRDGFNLEAIGFGLGGEKIIAGNSYDLAFNLESNVYNGFEQAQLSLVDIREAQG